MGSLTATRVDNWVLVGFSPKKEEDTLSNDGTFEGAVTKKRDRYLFKRSRQFSGLLTFTESIDDTIAGNLLVGYVGDGVFIAASATDTYRCIVDEITQHDRDWETAWTA